MVIRSRSLTFLSKGVREGVQAIRAIKYRKYVAKNYILTHAHLWHRSTQIQIQIEYLSQKMAQQA